jgi:hypothetical protein
MVMPFLCLSSTKTRCLGFVKIAFFSSIFGVDIEKANIILGQFVSRLVRITLGITGDFSFLLVVGTSRHSYFLLQTD